MARIERKYCLISTSYLAGSFDISILLHIWQNCVCFVDFVPIRTLCDAWHKEFESVLDISDFLVMECGRSYDRAILTATGTDDHELFCFRVNLLVPWQASLLLRE